MELNKNKPVPSSRSFSSIFFVTEVVLVLLVVNEVGAIPTRATSSGDPAADPWFDDCNFSLEGICIGSDIFSL